MKKKHKCFCGSKKDLKVCHPGIRLNSKFAKLYKLYNRIDDEIATKVKDNNIKVVCKKGCSECCYQVFPITEVEFCTIVDHITKRFNKKQIDELIEKSYSIKNYLEVNYPIFMKKLESDVTGYTADQIYRLNLQEVPNSLAQECIFLNNNECTIYKIRPIVCRTHGVGYLYDKPNKLCSKLKLTHENKRNFVDLSNLSQQNRSNYYFIDEVLKRSILRRPYPMFYWLCFITDNKMTLNHFKKTVFYTRYTLMSEEECIKDMMKSYLSR